MANQTVSTNLNCDDPTKLGLANGEQFTVNTGATLTINSDNRWSQQAAVIGAISIDSATGGKVLVDGTEVWWIPFDGGTGNVPVLPTLGTNDVLIGATPVGEFLGIWASIPGAPVAAAAAMPTTGFIKLRRKVDVIADNDVLTLTGGATVTVNSATGGQRGWLNIACTYQGTITVPRLGTFELNGDWFDLGLTSGASDQVITQPFMDYIPAIEIETAPGSGIYNKWLNAGTRWWSATANIAQDARGKFFSQQKNTITATTTSGSAVIPTADTTDIIVGMPVLAAANFAITSNLYVTAVNPGVSFTVSANANANGSTTFVVFTGNIVLAKSTAPAMGLLPAAGCKIRIPNICLSTSGSPYAGNTQPTTIADKYEFATTSAGAIDIDKCICNWYLNLSAPYSVILKNTFFTLTANIANAASPIELDNLACGWEGSTASTTLTISNCFSGGTIKNCMLVHYYSSAAGNLSVSLTDCADFTIEDCFLGLMGSSATVNTRGNATVHALQLTRCFDVDLTRITAFVGKISVVSCVRVNIYDTRVCDVCIGATTTTNSLTGTIDVNSASANVVIDGFSIYENLTNIHPYAAIVILASGAYDVLIRNIGTEAAPFNCGSANACGLGVTASVAVNVTIRRVYLLNTRTSPLSLANTVQNVLVENCKGDYADSQAIAALNAVFKGCRWTNSVTGQTAVYGRHWEDAFTGATTGRILLCCNEPLPATAAQAVVTAGTPKYTSTGNISMPTIGDQVVWEMPYFAIGYTSMQNVAPTITGTLTANITLEFQYDIGAGYNGTWLALSQANLFAIPAITPAVGIRFKIRATTAVANSTNALTYIRLDPATNATDQQLQYPLPTDASGVVSGFVLNSRIIVYNETTDTVMYDDIVAATSLVLNYYNTVEYSPGDVIRVYHAYYGGTTAMKKGRVTAIATATGWSAVVEQTVCDVYAAYYATYSVTGEDVYNSGEWIKDGVNLQADLDDPDNNWYAHRLFMWDKYQTWFVDGNIDFFLEISATDAGNINIGDLLLDNLNALTAKQADAINVVNNTSTLPVVNPTTGGGGITMYSGGKVLTTSTGGISPSEAQIKQWVLEAEIIPGWTMARAIRKITAMAASKTSGNNPAGGTVTIRNLDDTADEMSATVDANGNRTAVTQGS